MKCPRAEQWDLLAAEVLEGDEAERLIAHASLCPECRALLQQARREHFDRVRTYEAFDRGHDERRAQLMAALAELSPPTERVGWLARSRSRLGDVVMSANSKVSRRVAAVIVPAACVLLCVWAFLVPQQSAFAAAIERLQNAQTIVARLQVFMNGSDMALTDGELNLSSAYGMRFDMNLPGALEQHMYRAPGGPLIQVQPLMNSVIRMNGVENLEDDPRDSSPDGFLRKFQEMQGDADGELEPMEIDGHQVRGYLVLGEKLGLKDSEARLWVDEYTDLPVRIEVDVHVFGMFISSVYDRFEWDLPLPEEIFVPEIPEGAQTIDVTVPPADEETLLESLRWHAKVLNSYPMAFDPTSIGTAVSSSAVALGGAFEEGVRVNRAIADGQEVDLSAGLDDEENAGRDVYQRVQQSVLQSALRLGAAVKFIQKLKQSGAEPEYFGDYVTPADVDEVLMHWNVGDGQVRVIYGDLRVETVPALE